MSFRINDVVQEVIANQKDHTGYLLLVNEKGRVGECLPQGTLNLT